MFTFNRNLTSKDINATTNSTQSETSLTNDPTQTDIQTIIVEIVYIIIFILGMIGNIAMIFLLKRRRCRRRESPSNLLLLHVVFSETSVLLLNIPFDISLIHVGHRWIFGPAMCKILWPLQTLSLGSFVWTLTLLSYQRYRGIVNPCKPKLSTRSLNQIVLTIWVLSFAVVVPYGIFLEYQNDNCIETWNLQTRKCFTIIFFVVQYALPLIITMYCYIKITIVVRRGHASVRRHISGSVKAESRHKKRKLSAIRTAVLFTTIFAVCMLPHQVIWLWLEFGDYQDLNIQQILTFAYIFTFTSVFMNPLVYILSTPSVRKDVCFRAGVLRRKLSGEGSTLDKLLMKKRLSNANSATGASAVL